MTSILDLVKKAQAAKAAQPTTPAATPKTMGAVQFGVKSAAPVEKTGTVTKDGGFKLNLSRKEAGSLRSESSAQQKAFSPKVNIGKAPNIASLLKVAGKLPAVPDSIPGQQQTAEVVDVPILHIPAPAQQTDLVHDDDQQAAIQGAMENKFCCLIGAAGTGKTTTLKAFLARLVPTLQMLKRTKVDKETGETITTYTMPIVFCAYTGRAVEQMKRALPKEYHSSCGTIHGQHVLAYYPEYFDEVDSNGIFRTRMRFVPYHTAANRMPYLYYIIDEAGMCSVELWNIMRAAMADNAHVVLVGDINQLPPVYGRSILGYAMTKWPVFELRTIHRQAAGNPIIANAHRILQGLFPNKAEKQFDILDVGDKGSNGTQQFMLAAVKKLLSQGDFNAAEDAIIVPQNVGPLGQVQFNEYLTPIFNPGKRTAVKTGIALSYFAEGDKVMMTSNDKDNGLTNGQVGFITAINLNGNYSNKGAGNFSQTALQQISNCVVTDDDLGDDFKLTMQELEQEAGFEKSEEDGINQRQASHVVEVNFNGKIVPFSTAGEFRKLAPAYAITCHKSQGGEYPTVVILAHSANGKMLSREWLYTAVTRARNRVILVCNMRGLTAALKNQRIEGKTLQQKIDSYCKFAEEAERGGGELPVLPEPEKSEITEW